MNDHHYTPGRRITLADVEAAARAQGRPIKPDGAGFRTTCPTRADADGLNLTVHENASGELLMRDWVGGSSFEDILTAFGLHKHRSGAIRGGRAPPSNWAGGSTSLRSSPTASRAMVRGWRPPSPDIRARLAEAFASDTSVPPGMNVPYAISAILERLAPDRVEDL